MATEPAKWENITPDVLKPSIKHIREAFDEAEWKCGEVTKHLCYAALHPLTVDQASLVPYVEAFAVYKKIIGPLAVGEVHRLLRIGTKPAFFAAFSDAHRYGLVAEVRRLFNDVVQIALANSDILDDHPVEWAKEHFNILIDRKINLVEGWIKDVCDEQDYSKPMDTAEDFVPHQLGLEYIALLLQSPGRPMSALAVRNANVDVRATAAVREMEVSDGHLYQERSDATAMRQYKAEAARLMEEIADAKGRGDERRYAELLEQLETIEEHVRADTGRGGQSRKFSDEAENARVSVTKAIKRAIEAIGKQNSATADHLQTNIVTGAELMYRDALTHWATSLSQQA